ncbi:MAG: hypothetical protein ACM3YE_14525 [Bacteroidota bacterium]
MANKAELIKVFRTIFLEIFPELKGYHAPIRAKVIKVHESGGKIDEFNKRYSVDVQPLKPDGSVDDSAPAIPDVEIPIFWAGPNRGIFCLPVAGAVVRIGFYYNDPAYPFVDAILGDGYSIPDHPIGSLIIQHSDGTRIEISPNKNIEIFADGIIKFAHGGHPVAFADVVKSIFDEHTHPIKPGVTDPPSTKMTGHDSSKVFTG